MGGALLIETNLLPSGRPATLWIDGGRFVEGPLDSAIPFSGGYAVPGLVDCHAHLALASPLSDGGEEEAVRASARAHLAAGVLTVREPGSPNRASAGIRHEEGLPAVITAGRFLAPPGRYFPGLAREVDDAQLPAAAAEELTHSGGWVKVIGDFFDGHGRFTANYRLEALAEAAAVVHEAGGRITMHAVIADSIQQAIDAGFDAIEHGSVPEAGQVKAMAEAGMTWIPTAVIDALISESADEMLGADGALWIRQGLERHGEAIRLGHELGVRILAGTDAGMTAHGIVADEIRLLHALGLPAEAALASGSWDAREYLGLPGVEIGAQADLVVFPDDPRDNLEVLDHPALIMLRGTTVTSRSGR
jgi:imidazolonepropionase-like amidohydrolase